MMFLIPQVLLLQENADEAVRHQMLASGIMCLLSFSGMRESKTVYGTETKTLCVLSGKQRSKHAKKRLSKSTSRNARHSA